MSTVNGKVSRETRQHLFLLGLDRAAKRNAFDSHMIDDLSAALTEYENNNELRCAIIFAHGEHFTAGLDLAQLQPQLSSGIFSKDPNIINPWGTSGRTLRKPVIVAVHGYCYTAGIELMLNADIVIAQSNTQFSQIEVLRGILPFGGATSRFVKAAGWSNAMRYLLTGDQFDAETAYRLNLITENTSDHPLERAIELANHIAKAAPLAVQATLAAAKDAVELGEADSFQKLNTHLQPLLSSHDVQEGMMAMLQKRPPDFLGK